MDLDSKNSSSIRSAIDAVKMHCSRSPSFSDEHDDQAIFGRRQDLDGKPLFKPFALLSGLEHHQRQNYIESNEAKQERCSSIEDVKFSLASNDLRDSYISRIDRRGGMSCKDLKDEMNMDRLKKRQDAADDGNERQPSSQHRSKKFKMLEAFRHQQVEHEKNFHLDRDRQTSTTNHAEVVEMARGKTQRVVDKNSLSGCQMTVDPERALFIECNRQQPLVNWQQAAIDTRHFIEQMCQAPSGRDFTKFGMDSASGVERGEAQTIVREEQLDGQAEVGIGSLGKLQDQVYAIGPKIGQQFPDHHADCGQDDQMARSQQHHHSLSDSQQEELSKGVSPVVIAPMESPVRTKGDSESSSPTHNFSVQASSNSLYKRRLMNQLLKHGSESCSQDYGPNLGSYPIMPCLSYGQVANDNGVCSKATTPIKYSSLNSSNHIPRAVSQPTMMNCGSCHGISNCCNGGASNSGTCSTSTSESHPSTPNCPVTHKRVMSFSYPSHPTNELQIDIRIACHNPLPAGQSEPAVCCRTVPQSPCELHPQTPCDQSARLHCDARPQVSCQSYPHAQYKMYPHSAYEAHTPCEQMHHTPCGQPVMNCEQYGAPCETRTQHSTFVVHSQQASFEKHPQTPTCESHARPCGEGHPCADMHPCTPHSCTPRTHAQYTPYASHHACTPHTPYTPRTCNHGNTPTQAFHFQFPPHACLQDSSVCCSSPFNATTPNQRCFSHQPMCHTQGAQTQLLAQQFQQPQKQQQQHHQLQEMEQMHLQRVSTRN